jgi:hypothetical protein
MVKHSTVTREGSSVVAGSRPYPWPWDGRIDPASLALLVIQAPGSAPAATVPLDTIGALAELLERAGGTVIQVVTHAPFRRGIAQDTRPTGPSVLPVVSAAGPIVHAPGWNGFFDSTLDVELRRRDVTHLLLGGYWLEVGVHSTMRSGNDMGYECLLLEDAVVSADPTLTPASLSSIEMSGGIFGAIATSAAVTDAIRVAAVSTPSATSTEENPS